MMSRNVRLGMSGVGLGLVAVLLAGGPLKALLAEGEETPPTLLDRLRAARPAEDPAASGTKLRPREQAGNRATEKRLSVKYRNAPWREVLEKFAEDCGLGLDSEEGLPPGTVNYVDDGQSTLSEARDVLNGILLSKGYYLAPRDKSLVVANLSNRGALEGLVPSVTVTELARRGKSEILSVRMKVPPAAGELDAVVDDLLRLLGKWGKIVPLRSSREVLVQDTGSNLRQIGAFLEEAGTKEPKSSVFEARPETDTGAATPRDTEKRVSFSFRYASWKTVLEKFAEFTGSKLELDDLPDGTFNYHDYNRYTLEEALDILNSYLIRTSYYLWRGSDDLIVGTSLKNGVPEGLVRRVPLSELPRRGGSEFLMVRIPVPPIVLETFEDVEALVRPMLGHFGKVTFLPDAGVVLVRDTGTNLRTIAAAMTEGEPQKDASKPAATKIDAPVQRPASGVVHEGAGIAYREGGSSPDALAVLKSQYEESERETARIAAEYRQARERGDTGDAKVAGIKGRLQGKIQEAFDRRQEVQRMEAAILRHQLQRVDERLADRDRLKERITERRLQELLDPNVTWEAPSRTGDVSRP